LKINIGKNTTLVDQLGWATFVKARRGKTIDALYYFARWTNVVLLQAFFNNGTLNGTNTNNATSSKTKIGVVTAKTTYDDDGWILDMLRNANGTPEMRTQMMHKFIAHRRAERGLEGASAIESGKPVVQSTSATTTTTRLYTGGTGDLTRDYIFFIANTSTRLVGDVALLNCRDPFSHFLQSNKHARDYLSQAITINNLKDVIEGIFRLFDTIQWWLPMYLGCAVTYKNMEIKILETFTDQTETYWKPIVNFWANIHFIILDFFTLYSDNYFKDW
jgi:hypothetical protein